MNREDVKREQQRFLRAEFWMSSWAASVQRSGLYADRAAAGSASRNIFQSHVRSFVDRELLPKYTHSCAEDDHYLNIGELEKRGSHLGADLLANRYSFGVAQKLLNLYLKYHWCFGWIAEPPHCPIDRTVLKIIKLENRFNWTSMSKKDYRSAITNLKEVALQDGLSPAQWELREFRRRTPE